MDVSNNKTLSKCGTVQATFDGPFLATGNAIITNEYDA